MTRMALKSGLGKNILCLIIWLFLLSHLCLIKRFMLTITDIPSGNVKNPSTFNMNYIAGYGDLNLDLMVPGFCTNLNFLDLRYSNWQKDLFHGVLPVAQYGEASVVPLGGEMSVIPINEFATPLLEGKGAGISEGGSVILSKRLVPVVFDLKLEEGVNVGWNSPELKVPAANNNLSLSILALRRAEAAQKWKEVSLASEEDYPAQIGAHWGEKAFRFLIWNVSLSWWYYF